MELVVQLATPMQGGCFLVIKNQCLSPITCVVYDTLGAKGDTRTTSYVSRTIDYFSMANDDHLLFTISAQCEVKVNLYASGI